MDAMTQLVGLAKLRRESHTAAGRASHVLLWDAPYHGESGSTQTGRCACGLEAYCHVRNAAALQDNQEIGQVCYNDDELLQARCKTEEIRYAGDTTGIGES